MQRRTIRRVAVATSALVLVPALSAFRYDGFSNTAARQTAAKATTWLRTQQQPDGGFEVSGFAGFETPDAILAIGENAQQQAKWDRFQAKAAINAVKRNGHSALHAVDDFAASGLNAGQAAKLVVLVTKPLGLNPKKFDPDGDGAVNLKSIIDAGFKPNGSYGAFNATLEAAIAKRLLGGVPPQTVTYIRSAQQANGGWNFAGDKTGTDLDVDTTALAIEALVAARVPKTDVDLRQGLAFLARQHQGSGAWQSFGGDDPNSTSSAVFAITAAGYDPTVVCWRDSVLPAQKGQAYTSPIGWLRSQQQTDGRIVSQFDGPTPTTFATTQTIEALRRGWLPVKPLGKQQCS